MKHFVDFKRFMQYAGIFLLVTGYQSCSADDEISVEIKTPVIPTGIINIGNRVALSGNILTVPSVKVGQDSWLAAVGVGDEATNNFIAEPVLVEKGTNSNVQLTFDEPMVSYSNPYAEVILKLYVDNLEGGIRGEWDAFDKPIVTAKNGLVIRIITIEADYSNYSIFRDSYDLNGDLTLDLREFSKTYANHFQAIWDVDKDGYLDLEEFFFTQFINADSNWNGEITREEWSEGDLRMFGNWTHNDFSTFDEDNNKILTRKEWFNGFEESEWFETYDTNSDNLITEQELNEGFFGDWDLNDDGKIEESEFNNYQPYVVFWEWWYWFYE